MGSEASEKILDHFEELRIFYTHEILFKHLTSEDTKTVDHLAGPLNDVLEKLAFTKKLETFKVRVF
jgi:hypothetical protein